MQLRPECDRRVSYTDDFELVAFRHRDFRRVTNPTSKSLQELSPVLKSACARFMRMNRRHCKVAGLEFEDLMTYANVWAISFLGLYAGDDHRHLWSYLKQRFYEFSLTLKRKLRSCTPSYDCVEAAGRGPGFNTAIVEPIYGSETVISGPDLPDIVTFRLKSLPHDEMVQKLLSVAFGVKIDKYIREDALSRLQNHQVNCQSCAAVNFHQYEPKPLITDDNQRLAYQQSLPALLKCCRCKQMIPRENFGIRVMNGAAVREGAKPVYGHQYGCQSCRRSKRNIKK